MDRFTKIPGIGSQIIHNEQGGPVIVRNNAAPPPPPPPFIVYNPGWLR